VAPRRAAATVLSTSLGGFDIIPIFKSLLRMAVYRHRRRLFSFFILKTPAQDKLTGSSTKQPRAPRMTPPPVPQCPAAGRAAAAGAGGAPPRAPLKLLRLNALSLGGRGGGCPANSCVDPPSPGPPSPHIPPFDEGMRG